MGPGSMPGSALWAGMTEVEHACSDSVDLSEAFIVVHGTFLGLQRIGTIPKQERTEEGLLLLSLFDKGRGKANKSRDLGSKDDEASAQPGCHKRVQ